MLFNSYEFIFAFLPITFIVFILISKINIEKAIAWLVAASLFFYGWWNPSYLILIIFSMMVNYSIGYYVNKLNHRVNIQKLLFTTGIIFNLSLLGYYKYSNFFLETVAYAVSSHYETQHIILPLAISFFTFQQVAFLVDAYRGITKEYKFLHYALFVTFFPQLIAGPIVHHKEMLPQFMDRINMRFKINNVTIGMIIFSIGLFKKAVLADGIAAYSNPVFSMIEAGHKLGFFQSWGGALSYSFQLYFDFSGYSDMAIGGARLFGIKLPLNFHSPYKSLNIIEFWRRWHITLSRFLRDYLYIELGGNRKGNIRRYFNLLITMALGGLWHGAGWTFVIWGVLHGLYLIINHFWHFVLRKLNLSNLTTYRTWKAFAWSLTFMAVVIGWVFFRSTNFDSAIILLKGMSGFYGVSIPLGVSIHFGSLAEILKNAGVEFSLGGGKEFIMTYIWIIFLLPAALIWPNTQQIMDKFEPSLNAFSDNPATTLLSNNYFMRKIKFGYSYNWALVMSFILIFGILALTQISEFLYFRF